MAEAKDDPEVKHTQKHPPFVEVVCKSSGKIRRFSAGTESGFAVNLINKKLLIDDGGFGNILMTSHIEAVNEEEEEPVSFGPNSMLVDYGPGWKLQTVFESYDDAEVNIMRRAQKASAKGIDDSDSTITSQSPITCVYISKILLAFVLLFVIGAAFTLVLENLPRLILYVNASV